MSIKSSTNRMHTASSSTLDLLTTDDLSLDEVDQTFNTICLSSARNESGKPKVNLGKVYGLGPVDYIRKKIYLVRFDK